MLVIITWLSPGLMASLGTRTGTGANRNDAPSSPCPPHEPNMTSGAWGESCFLCVGPDRSEGRQQPGTRKEWTRTRGGRAGSLQGWPIRPPACTACMPGCVWLYACQSASWPAGLPAGVVSEPAQHSRAAGVGAQRSSGHRTLCSQNRLRPWPHVHAHDC